MIIAGNCLFTDINETNEIMETAWDLSDVATHFRCKLWGGGTTPEKYMPGIGEKGIAVLENINLFLPAGTEIQTPEQAVLCKSLSFLWVGARNAQNYGLLGSLKDYLGDIFIKRSPGMTIDEVIGLWDIMKKRYNQFVHIVERGINTFDRQDQSRWSPDIKGAIRLKHERPDIFKRYIVDCSHSVGVSHYVEDVFHAFRAIGVKHFMFETATHPETAKTDKNQIISVKKLQEILDD